MEKERVKAGFQKTDSFADELKAEARYIKNTREREMHRNTENLVIKGVVNKL